MTGSPLPPDHSVGPVVLHADGSLTLTGGMTLRNQTLTNYRFADGLLEVTCKRGSTRVSIEFYGGRCQAFVFSRGAWRELSEEESAGLIWRGLLLLKRIRWTSRKVAICAFACVLLAGLVVWLAANDEQRHEREGSVAASVRQSETPATPQAQSDPHATDNANVKGKSVSPGVATKPKLSDEEIVRSQHLTYEQKRSQLYDLAEIARGTVDELRAGANYRRTSSRLSRYRVVFSDETERAFSELVDRVNKHSRATDMYCETMNKRLAAIRRMESQIYEGVKAGTIDPEVRRLYIVVTASHISRPSGFGTPDFDAVRSRVVRRAVSADDLFEELVIIRCCQRCIEVAAPVDKNIAKLLGLLPDKLLALGTFSRKWTSLQQELRDATDRLLALNTASRNYPTKIQAAEQKVKTEQEAFDRIPGDQYRPFQSGASLSEAKRKLKEIENGQSQLIATVAEAERDVRNVTKQLESLLPLGLTLEDEERQELLAQLAEEAGILEEALKEQLLEYPWPWKVSSVKPKQKLFELAPEPAAERR